MHLMFGQLTSPRLLYIARSAYMTKDDFSLQFCTHVSQKLIGQQAASCIQERILTYLYPHWLQFSGNGPWIARAIK
jgi:hypothetical protein